MPHPQSRRGDYKGHGHWGPEFVGWSWNAVCHPDEAGLGKVYPQRVTQPSPSHPMSSFSIWLPFTELKSFPLAFESDENWGPQQQPRLSSHLEASTKCQPCEYSYFGPSSHPNASTNVTWSKSVEGQSTEFFFFFKETVDSLRQLLMLFWVLRYLAGVTKT